MKLSIIIPVYNLEEYILKTLDSIEKIYFPYEYEIIIVNDGSTDKSRVFIEQYQKENGNLRLINIDNRGVSYARNIGMQNSKGEYITFVDGDDTVDPYYFAKAVAELDKGQYDFVQFNLAAFSNKGTKPIQNVQEDIVIDNRYDMLERFWGSEKIIHNSVCEKVFRASVIRDLSFDTSVRIAEDQKFIFEVIQRANRIKLVSYMGYYYRERSSSVTQSFDLEKQYDGISVLQFCKEHVESKKIKYYIDRRMIGVLLCMYDSALLHNFDYTRVYNDLMVCDCKSFKRAFSKINNFKLSLLLTNQNLYNYILRLKNRHNCK